MFGRRFSGAEMEQSQPGNSGILFELELGRAHLEKRLDRRDVAAKEDGGVAAASAEEPFIRLEDGCVRSELTCFCQ